MKPENFYQLAAKTLGQTQQSKNVCQQCGKFTKAPESLTHEMVFKLLSKEIVPKLTLHKLCSPCKASFDEDQFRKSTELATRSELCLVLSNAAYPVMKKVYKPESGGDRKSLNARKRPHDASNKQSEEADMKSAEARPSRNKVRAVFEYCTCLFILYKTKVSGKTKVAKQHTADQAGKNRLVTRVRNIIERVFPIAIKSWGVLGGKNLQYQYFEYIPAYADIASAFHNAFRGCIDLPKGPRDQQDFDTISRRILHQNLIQHKILEKVNNTYALKSGKFQKFSPEEEKDSLPHLTLEQIRVFACGQYAMDLADPYLEFWPKLGTEVKFHKVEALGGLLIKASGLKSRYSPANSRVVYILFKGDPYEIVDTLCTCHGGLRTVGGCAHAIAILIKLGQITGNIAPRKATISEQILKRGLVLFKEDGESSDEDSSSSEAESDSEPDSQEGSNGE